MRELWFGRSAFRLTNGIVETVVLLGGGHIVEFRFSAASRCPAINTIWQPPWPTADPGSDEYATLMTDYGDPATGRFLASFAGHALCLDGFGPPSNVEAQKGVPLHGEAAVALWRYEENETTNLTSAVAELPIAGLRVTRQFECLPGESVLRIDEQVRNLQDIPRDLHWVQHATFGPPFLAAGASTVNASVSRGTTWPCGYEEHEMLPDDAPFSWPNVQSTNGERIDLRDPFRAPGRGFVAAVQQDHARTFSFIAAVNTSLGLAVGYCFRRDLFPWFTIWEENCARTNPPWNGMTQARGMEFGTTPFPLGKDEIAKRGDLFGERTAHRVGPNVELRAPWLMFLAIIPPNWRVIDDVRIGPDTIELISGYESINIAAMGIQLFLEGFNPNQ